MRGLSSEYVVDVVKTRGLSREQIHKRFINYKDVNEKAVFASAPSGAVAAIIPATISATSTVGGAVTKAPKQISGNVAATSTVGGYVAKSKREAVTLTSGLNIHDGVILAKKMMFGMTNTNPGILVRVPDPNDLTTINSVTFASDAKHIGTSSEGVVYDPGTDKIYVVFKSYFDIPADSLIRIEVVDPSNISTHSLFLEFDSGSPNDQGNPSITTDGTYLYVLTAPGSENAWLHRINISTATLVNSLQITGTNKYRGHPLTYDAASNKLYFGGTKITVTKNTWVGWATPDLSSHATIDLPGAGTFNVGDDMVVIGSFFYVNKENETTPSGTVLKVATDLSSTTPLNTGFSSDGVDGMYYDGTNLWVASNGSPGNLVQMSLTGTVLRTIALNSGENLVNEIMGFQTSLLITTIQTPSMLLRIPLVLPPGARTISPANISATSTVSGSVGALRKIAPASIAATSTVSGTVTAQKKITPGTVSATSTVSGTVTRLGSNKPITPSANVSATSTVFGSIVAQRRITTASVAAASTVSGSLVAQRLVPPASISASSTVSGSIFAGAAPFLLGSPMVGWVGLSQESHVDIVKSRGLSQEQIHRRVITYKDINEKPLTGFLPQPQIRPITGGISATSTVLGAVTAQKRITAGNINATSTVSAFLGQPKVIQLGLMMMWLHGVSSLKSVTPASIAATSTVSGAIGAQRKITPASIAATSTVSGNVAKLFKVIAAAIAATSSVSGAIGRKRPILSATISATSTVAGAIFKTGQIVGSIAATCTVAGKVTALHKITTASIAATSTVTVTRVSVLRKISGTITATSTASGTVTHTFRVVPASIAATSTVTGALRARRAVVPGNVSATSTVSGAISRQFRVQPTTISATSTVSGVVTKSTHSSITPSTQISAFATVTGQVTATKAVKPATIIATSTVAGSLRMLRGIQPASISATSQVTGKVVARKTITPLTIISAFSTVNGNIRRARSISGGMINATSTVKFSGWKHKRYRGSGLQIISQIRPSIESVTGNRPTIERVD